MKNRREGGEGERAARSRRGASRVVGWGLSPGGCGDPHVHLSWPGHCAARQAARPRNSRASPRRQPLQTCPVLVRCRGEPAGGGAAAAKMEWEEGKVLSGELL